MSTRCSVNFYDINNGTYESIYGHHDGYLNHTGVILLTSYDTIEKVKELIAMGDFSVLHHSLEDSVFYCRDRNEDFYLTKAASYRSLSDIPLQSYNYVFNGASWFYFQEGKIALKPLTIEAIKGAR